MLWNFFGSGHGKGEWDGAGAVVKRALRLEQLINPNRPLQNARDCVTFLDATMAGPVSIRNGRIRSFRYFHLVGMNEVDRGSSHACRKITGSSKLHSVFAPDARDPTKFLLRTLSSFCGPCLEGDFRNCKHQAYVPAWKVHKIEPLNVLYAQAVLEAENPEDDDNWEYELNEDHMADLVQAGDNFAIPAEADNAEGASFYILQCQTAKQCVQKEFECPWGGKFKEGDFVITGTYYQKWGRVTSQNYVYLKDSRPTHIDADIVLACKFQMIPRAHRVKGGDPVYSLPPESADVITCALEEYQDCH